MTRATNPTGSMLLDRSAAQPGSIDKSVFEKKRVSSGIAMKIDQIFRWLPFGVQIAAYLWLAWVAFFSGFDRRIPVPYMATHVVFGIHTLIVLGTVGVRLVHGPTGIWMNWVVAAYAPILLAEIVILLMR